MALSTMNVDITKLTQVLDSVCGPGVHTVFSRKVAGKWKIEINVDVSVSIPSLGINIFLYFMITKFNWIYIAQRITKETSPNKNGCLSKKK